MEFKLQQMEAMSENNETAHQKIHLMENNLMASMENQQKLATENEKVG